MRHKKTCSIVLLLALVVACADDAQETDSYEPARDYFTFANTSEFVMQHVALDLEVDFDAQRLRGSVVLTMRRLDETATEIRLDTRDIAISRAEIEREGRDPIVAAYRLGESDPIRGTPLIVTLPDAASALPEFDLRLEYTTSPDASALQWLPAELTSGGAHPLMFSQSQAIHARSWIPLQDTPAVRITYEATIRTPPELLAVMSANNDPLAARRGEYHFTMPQPIPPYLVAIAVGNIFFAPLGEQTGVYAEPELLEASVWEFADTQQMLERAERLFGPYEWGRYDLLVLPPSFPYGGMENPRLSFITPSLLAGDRSLVSTVAHELAHSWSGNLVTNATWRDQWLNEGMTSYLESRLMEIIYGADRVDEERVLAYEELLLDLATVPSAMQALAPRLDTGNPDDFQGTIHYNKGRLFLEYLENSFGRDVFDRFLFSYFGDFAFQTITTERFLDYLDEKLLSAEPGNVSRAQAEQWLYQPGLPDDTPLPGSSTLAAAEESAAAWLRGEIDVSEIPVESWSPQAMVHFINSLPADLPDERLQLLDRGLGLSTTPNAEIGRTWFIQVAKRRHTGAYEALESYLNRYGRGRLVRPVYEALAANGSDLALAREMFLRARTAYHPYVKTGVARALGLDTNAEGQKHATAD